MSKITEKHLTTLYAEYLCELKILFLYCLLARLEDITGRQGKDAKTGLYYYGQRYLDPRYNIWTTSDPAIYEYMSQSKAGEGGIYNITNLNLYHYAGNNPVKYTDPDGRAINDLSDDLGGKVNSAMTDAINNFTNLSNSLEQYLNSDEDKILDSAIIDSASKWLGIDLDSDKSVSDLKDNIDLILNGLNDITTYKYNDSPNYKNVYAYVYSNKNDHTIYFGGASLTASNSGNDTLTGTIIHEVSHKALKTKDVKLPNGETAYGTEKALKLEKGKMINNADNWEYFYERLYTEGK